MEKAAYTFGMGLFLSIFLGLVGGGFLWIGKKRSDVKLLLWGAALSILSYFCGGFQMPGTDSLGTTIDVRRTSNGVDRIVP
jgi:hypothetical protein